MAISNSSVHYPMLRLNFTKQDKGFKTCLSDKVPSKVENLIWLYVVSMVIPLNQFFNWLVSAIGKPRLISLFWFAFIGLLPLYSMYLLNSRREMQVKTLSFGFIILSRVNEITLQYSWNFTSPFSKLTFYILL